MHAILKHSRAYSKTASNLADRKGAKIKDSPLALLVRMHLGLTLNGRPLAAG